MKTRQPTENRGGFVLALVLTTVVLLSVMGLSLIGLGSAARVQSVRTRARTAARAAADAGYTRALHEMNKNLNIKPWSFRNITSPVDAVLPHANAAYTYTIDEIEKDAEYQIISIGRSGRQEQTVSATVRLQGFFDYAMCAQGYALPKQPKRPKEPKRPKKGGKIEIKGYNVESYSSDLSIPAGGLVQLRTNSIHKKAVKIREDVVVDADIVVGPGGDPDEVIEVKKGAKLTGDTYAAAEMIQPEPPPLGDGLDKLPTKTYKYKKNKSLSGKNRYKDLTIPKKAVQEVKGNCVIYVEGDFKVEDEAEIRIDENGSLTVYVGEKLEIKKKSAGINNMSKLPKNLVIYGLDTCEKIKIENPSSFYGAVYAPYSKVEIKESGDIYGALVGWDVKIKKKKGTGHGTFYYDRSLGSGNVSASDDNGSRFVIKTWREE